MSTKETFIEIVESVLALLLGAACMFIFMFI